MLCDQGKYLIECLRAQTTCTKTPVLAINFRVPMESLSPYLNSHISAESLRYEDDKATVFHNNFEYFFPALSFSDLKNDDVMITSPQQASS